MEHHTLFMVLAVISIGSEAFLIFLALFNPGLRYKISSPGKQPLDSDDFLRTPEAVTDAKMRQCTQFEVLTNGDNFYEAMLDAIRKAARSINLECYIFQKGEVPKITLREWSKRPVFEHAHEMVGWIFERQQ